MFARNNKIESLVGEDAKFTGDLVIRGTIRIDGNVLGNVDVDWLILGETAFLQGNVSACGVVVGGKMEGNINAKESVSVKNKGNIKGNIKTVKLMVDEGAIIDGMMIMSPEAQAEAEQVNENPKVTELKNDRSKADKVKNIRFGEVKFEEAKSL